MSKCEIYFPLFPEIRDTDFEKFSQKGHMQFIIQELIWKSRTFNFSANVFDQFA